MKHLIVILIMFTFLLNAQDSTKPKFEKQGKLTKEFFIMTMEPSPKLDFLRTTNYMATGLATNPLAKKWPWVLTNQV